VGHLVPFIACLLLLESDDLAAFHLIDLVLLQIFYFCVIYWCSANDCLLWCSKQVLNRCQ